MMGSRRSDCHEMDPSNCLLLWLNCSFGQLFTSLESVCLLVGNTVSRGDMKERKRLAQAERGGMIGAARLMMNGQLPVLAQGWLRSGSGRVSAGGEEAMDGVRALHGVTVCT